MVTVPTAAKVTKVEECFSLPIHLVDRLYRFSVHEYDRMGAEGILGPSDRVELLDGWIIEKMTIHPSHSYAVQQLMQLLPPLLLQGWIWRSQQPIVLKTSEPEPDFAVVSGPASVYRTRHPHARDIALVVEVADTSLSLDRDLKLRLYAAERLPVYWIVNLVDRCVEVYSQPRAGKSPTYKQVELFAADTAVPFVVAAQQIGQIPVADLLP